MGRCLLELPKKGFFFKGPSLKSCRADAAIHPVAPVPDFREHRGGERKVPHEIPGDTKRRAPFGKGPEICPEKCYLVGKQTCMSLVVKQLGVPCEILTLPTLMGTYINIWSWGAG